MIRTFARRLALGAAMAFSVAAIAAAQTPQMPHTFANASGQIPASWLDDDYTYLLNLIVARTANPQISYSPPSLTAPVAAGTAAGTATVSGLTGGSWSISPTSDFAINASTGAVTADTTVSAGTYNFTLAYSVTMSGQTTSVSLPTSIVVASGGGSNNPAFFFTDGSNLISAAAVF